MNQSIYSVAAQAASGVQGYDREPETCTPASSLRLTKSRNKWQR